MRNFSWVLFLLVLSVLTGCAAAVVGGVGAGVGGGVLVAEDRRTAGTIVDDEAIELKAGHQINERVGNQVHINVTSYNRNVLLTGEAPTEALKAEVEKVARGVENMQNVTNEIAVAGPTSYGSRSNDAYITSKVKARFLDARKFQINYVKVVTENGVVFLLGLVKRQEAVDAVEIARTTGGVQKVVKVFEYID